MKPEFLPAFPAPIPGIQGMELRDYFAAKAMQALVSQRCYPWDNKMPEYAYQIADAMLAERENNSSK